MKNIFQSFFLSLAAAFGLSAMVLAQEKTEVTVQVKQDGNIVKDTTYQFDNDADAKQALKMMEVISGEGANEMKFNYTMALSEGDENNTMVFISKDGEKTELRQMGGDSLVWVSEGEEEDGPVKVMKYKVDDGDHPGGKNVVVVTSGDGETFDILIDDESEGAPVKKEKRVKVIITDEESGDMQVTEEKWIDKDQKVYVISGDDSEKELKEIMDKVKEEDGGEDVKVIVIKKGDQPEQNKDK